MQVVWPLDLRNVAGVESHVLRRRDRIAYMALEPCRHQRIPVAPDEQRGRLEIAQAVPEALGVLQVDLARGGVERGSATGGRVGAQELVDPGRGVARAAARD